MSITGPPQAVRRDCHMSTAGFSNPAGTGLGDHRHDDPRHGLAVEVVARTRSAAG